MPIPESGCWIWEGACGSDGYGHIRRNGKVCGAHRISYETFIDKIPEKMHVLHKCDIKLCINPHHLFLGTNSENQIDSVKKGRHAHRRKTHCKVGHEFDQNNTYIKPDGERRCLTCHRQQDRIRQRE